MNTASTEIDGSIASPKFGKMRITSSSMTVEAWIPSEIEAISPLVDWLMQLIKRFRGAAGNEAAVELALREALNNAVLHGNGMDAHKLVEVCCCCESGKGVWLIVKDQGNGFDPNAVPDALAPDRLEAEHGRGICLMRSSMDQVLFEHGGTEVRMWKGPELATESSALEKLNQASATSGIKGQKGKLHETSSCVCNSCGDCGLFEGCKAR